jgi:hypothetical protein
MHAQAAQRELLPGLSRAQAAGGIGTNAAVAQEANVQGVSTRSVDDLVRAFEMVGIFKREFGRPRAEIDAVVKRFLAGRIVLIAGAIASPPRSTISANRWTSTFATWKL